MDRDKDTFLQIIESHKLIIFKVCNSYCKDQEDQKDLVQEVILQLWNAFDKYDDKYKLSTWIYRISLNVAISNYRKLKTQHKYFTPFEEEMVGIAEDDLQEKREDERLLQTFIEQLDELNKALMLLYLDGHSHEEMAAMLDISKSNVGSKINRIKNKLKQQFKNLES
ncbi:MAG: RNA polymerase sigma factor (sigma-70 family) [Cyclobacteriaceae bacterium]|jgi:RNA polymerase sigma factor (sigma-70 family)